MSWLPKWAQRIGAICHRNDGCERPLAVNRLLVIRAERRALRAVWEGERNVEQLEAIEARLAELAAEAKDLMGVGR
jgi:hypothetical protein